MCYSFFVLFSLECGNLSETVSTGGELFLVYSAQDLTVAWIPVGEDERQFAGVARRDL